MNPFSIAVLGGDLRQYYLADYFIQNGYDVICCGNSHFETLPEKNNTKSLDRALQQDIILGPVPFTKNKETLNASFEIPLTFCTKLKENQILAGGNIPSFVKKICSEKSLSYYDYMKSHDLMCQNAEITAEGLLCEIIQNTCFTLQNAKALLIGYGTCGAAIAKKLHALGCRLSIWEKEEERRNLAEASGFQIDSGQDLLQYQMILNTAPELVLTEKIINKLQRECIIFDIASLPGGVDWKAAKKAGRKAYHCLGLPGKTAPKTAGEEIAKSVINDVEYNILRKG